MTCWWPVRSWLFSDSRSDYKLHDTTLVNSSCTYNSYNAHKFTNNYRKKKRFLHNSTYVFADKSEPLSFQSESAEKRSLTKQRPVFGVCRELWRLYDPVAGATFQCTFPTFALGPWPLGASALTRIVILFSYFKCSTIGKLQIMSINYIRTSIW